MGFKCECGKIGEWHDSNLQGDAWSAMDANREELQKATTNGVYIVNAACISKTDKVLMSGEGWAIVEYMEE